MPFSVFAFVIFFNECEIETLDVVANVNYEARVRSFCRTRTYFTGVAEETIEVLLIDSYTSDRKR